MDTTSEKLQKVLAQAGFGSRRQMESWISEGRIKINGKLATLGDRVTGNEQFEIDNRAIVLKIDDTTQVIAYHKPVGEMSTRHDPEGRPTVFANLPKLRGARWIGIGRLDVNTSGLLLLTTNGELANRLMHPSRSIEREYAIRILGKPTPEHLQQLQRGIELEDGMAHFKSVRDAGGEGANHWYHVVLTEGKRREARRLWEALGFTVSRLMRIRYGDIPLPAHLRQGHHQPLEPQQIQQLMDSVSLAYSAPKIAATPAPRTRSPRRPASAKKTVYQNQPPQKKRPRV